MENALIPGMSNEEFLQALNNATGYTDGIKKFPIMKFDGEVGQFKIQTDQKDADGNTVWQDIGNEIIAHIITRRQFCQSSFDSGIGNWSQESRFATMDLRDSTGKIIDSGKFKELQARHKDLVFVQSVYLFWNEQPYRLQLSGFKLTDFFAYMNDFKGSNPAMIYTVMKAGRQLKKTKDGIIPAMDGDIMKNQQAIANGRSKPIVIFYELLLSKDAPVEQQTIIDRVNLVNEYFSVVEGAAFKPKEVPNGNAKAIAGDIMPIPENIPIDSSEDIKVEDIPF